MKKLVFLIISACLFTACEQAELTEPTSSEQSLAKPELRATNYPSNPIEQIVGMPVNIKLTPNSVGGNNYYLSAQTKKAPVVLYSKDDNSGRQKWIIRKSMMSGPGLNDLYCIELYGGGPSNLKYIMSAGTSENSYPVLAPGAGLWWILNIPNTNLYTLCGMGAESYNSTSLIMKQKNDNDRLQIWEITPIEEFKLVDIYYEMSAGDKFNVVPRYIKKWTVYNELNKEITRNIAISEKTSNTATFSETTGLKVSSKIASEFKVGIPLVSEGKINTEIVTDRSWSYITGKTETKELSIIDNITHTFKPLETVIVEIIGTEYQMNLTYVSKLQGVNTGKVIYLRGKWNSMIVSETNIYIKNPSGNIISTRSVKAK